MTSEQDRLYRRLGGSLYMQLATNEKFAHHIARECTGDEAASISALRLYHITGQEFLILLINAGYKDLNLADPDVSRLDRRMLARFRLHYAMLQIARMSHPLPSKRARVYLDAAVDIADSVDIYDETYETMLVNGKWVRIPVSFSNVVGPHNQENSCFCDSALISLFMGVEFLDQFILAKPTLSLTLANEALAGAPYTKDAFNLEKKVEGRIKLCSKLEHFVKLLRTPQTRREENGKLARHVSDIRETLLPLMSEASRRHYTSGRQADTAEWALELIEAIDATRAIKSSGVQQIVSQYGFLSVKAYMAAIDRNSDLEQLVSTSDIGTQCANMTTTRTMDLKDKLVLIDRTTKISESFIYLYEPSATLTALSSLTEIQAQCAFESNHGPLCYADKSRNGDWVVTEYGNPKKTIPQDQWDAFSVLALLQTTVTKVVWPSQLILLNVKRDPNNRSPISILENDGTRKTILISKAVKSKYFHYIIKAIAVHSGGANGGHYRAYVWAPQGEMCYHYNDAVGTFNKISDMTTQTVYDTRTPLEDIKWYSTMIVAELTDEIKL